MLTATYAFVAVSAEQKTTRSVLSRLKKYINDYLTRAQDLDVAKIESTLNHLNQLEQYCHARKLEMYLIPSVRGTAKEIDSVLAELESMSAHAIDALKSAQEKLQQSCEQGIERLKELFGAMAAYCDNLMIRLTKEEEELLPLLGKMLPVDAWFSIAAKFLSEDEQQKRHQVSLPHVPMI